jgi:hypothetical protein
MTGASRRARTAYPSTKGVIRNLKSKEDREDNGQKIKDKKTNNELCCTKQIIGNYRLSNPTKKKTEAELGCI